MGFGPLGLPELLIIFIVALLVFGPKKLPEVARTVGKALSMFRKASQDFQSTIRQEIQVEELKTMAMETPPADVADSVKPEKPKADYPDDYPLETERGKQHVEEDQHPEVEATQNSVSEDKETDDPYAD